MLKGQLPEANYSSSLASVDSATAGRLGIVSLVYYFTTTMLAVILGIVLVLTIQPGKWTKTAIEELVEQPKTAPCISNAIDTVLDLVKSVVQ